MNIQEATSLLNFLFEASETDAYKYSKRSFSELDPELQDELKENAKDPEHWMKECFHDLCTRFGLRNSDSMYFAPGLVRIAYGELDMDGDEEQSAKLLLLRRYVDFITTAHKDDFTRFLVYTHKDADGNETKTTCTFDDLDNMFGEVTSENISNEYEAIANKKYKSSNYDIIWLKDYETAHKYLEYTYDNPWCYFEDEETFKIYTNGGSTKLYLAVTPGFKDLKPGDKGYGQSMLGIDVDPRTNELPAVLLHVSNRYNHDYDPELDNEKNPPGDNRFTAEELSDLLGMPFWKACPPYTKEELRAKGILSDDEYIADFKNYIKTGEKPKWLINNTNFDMADYTGIVILSNNYNDKIRLEVLCLKHKQYVFDSNANLIINGCMQIWPHKTDRFSEDYLFECIDERCISTYYILDHETKELKPILKLPIRYDVNLTKTHDITIITVNGHNDQRIIAGKNFEKELKFPEKFIEWNNLYNNIYAKWSSNDIHFRQYCILFEITENDIRFLFNGAIFKNVDKVCPIDTYYCYSMSNEKNELILYSAALNKILTPNNIKHVKYIDEPVDNVFKFTDEYDNSAYYQITSNNEFKCIIPLCSSVEMDNDYGCYIAKRGGNRGFDIYNLDFKFIGNISSLKYLPKLMRR